MTAKLGMLRDKDRQLPYHQEDPFTSRVHDNNYMGFTRRSQVEILFGDYVSHFFGYAESVEGIAEQVRRIFTPNSNANAISLR